MRYLKVGAALLAATLATAPLVGQTARPPVKITRDMLEAGPPPGSSIPDDSVIFRSYGKDWTKQEFEEVARLFPPRGLSPQPGMPQEYSLDNFPIEDIRTGIETFVAGQVAAKRAAAEGKDIPERYQAQYNRQFDDFLRNLWLRQNGVRDVETPTDEETREFYENNTAIWEREELFVLRNLFLSTYEEYVVQEGDSLASIAEKVSGDASKADQIRDPNTPDRRPRIESLEATNGEELAALALTPGEALLVPMDDEAAGELEEEIQGIWEELEEGGDFSALAMEHSENTTAGNRMQVRREMNGKPVLPELIDTFMELENGEYSEPIRTRHGWQIILRDNYRPGGAPAYETVKENARSLLKAERQREKFRVLAEAVLEELGVEIDEEVLANYADPEYADQVIVTFGDSRYTADAFKRDFGERIDEETTVEEMRAFLFGLPGMQRVVFDEVITDPALSNSRDADLMRQSMNGLYHLTALADETAADLSVEGIDEEVAARFADMEDTSPPPPMAFLHQITLRPVTDAEVGTPEFTEALEEKTEELRERLGDVASVTDFEILARRISEDDYAERGGSRGAVTNELIEDDLWLKIVNEAPTDSLLGPIPAGDRVVAFWVGNKRIVSEEVHHQTLRDRIRETLLREERSDMSENLVSSLAEEAGLTIMLPDPEEEDLAPAAP